MSDLEFLILVLILSFATALTRFLPFIVFRKKGSTPKIIDYLGKVLPASMMGLLVIYCFKDVNFLSISEVIPTLVASLTVVFLHLWKRNTILSIAIGTIVYMVLIRVM